MRPIDRPEMLMAKAAEIFDLSELCYNRQRRHPSLGGLSPSQFELKNN